jgi:hypothetical protein
VIRKYLYVALAAVAVMAGSGFAGNASAEQASRPGPQASNRQAQQTSTYHSYLSNPSNRSSTATQHKAHDHKHVATKARSHTTTPP